MSFGSMGDELHLEIVERLYATMCLCPGEHLCATSKSWQTAWFYFTVKFCAFKHILGSNSEVKGYVIVSLDFVRRR